MIAKPRPKLLEKREAKADRDRIDREQNALVKQRSGGQCEALIGLSSMIAKAATFRRCARRASHVHHLISGIGRRNVGESIEAAHKLHVCDNCHAEIHGHVLKPENEMERSDAATVVYERVR
jgi:hypothetical protein